MPRSMRPLESWSSVAAVIAVIAGVRPGIWKIAEPILIALGVRRQPGEHGRGVGPVGLGGPDGVEAGGLGLLDDLELLLGRQPESPIPNVQAQPHCKSPFNSRHDLEVADGASYPRAAAARHRMTPVYHVTA